jgi:CheY-like chemotaxis protein
LTGLVLEEKGYDTVIAEGGLDALERLADDPSIALVVSDMFMPMMDGAELFAELREQGILLPFVLLTGQEAAPLQAAHPEIDAILTKDEQFQETLPATVTLLLNRS